jgi:hypothetical protein
MGYPPLNVDFFDAKGGGFFLMKSHLAARFLQAAESKMP